MTGRLSRFVAAERRRQRGRLLMASACAAVAAVASVLLLGLSGWFIAAAALAGAGGSAFAFNTMLPSACIRLLAILRTTGRYAERVGGHDAALCALSRLRPALYRAMAAAPPGRALAVSAGDAAARAVQDVNEVEAHFVRQPSVFGAAAACVAGIGLLWLAGGPAAACVAIVPAAILAIAWRLAAALEVHGRAVPDANGRLKGEFASLAAATAELRAYGLEEWAADRIAERADALVAAQRNASAANGWFDLLHASGTGLAAMLALWAARAQPVPTAALAALGAAAATEGLGAWLRSLQRCGQRHAAEARLDALLEMSGEGPPLPPVLAASPVIAFPGWPAVLAPGAMIGITGPSGCGKTTLLNQLLRLCDVERGTITLDRCDINDLDPASVQRCFATVPQDAAHLAGTVRDNLLLASATASDAALWAALRDAALEDRVRSLPDGLDTWLGEDGARLSGGERRRLALARAYLRPAPWLLLDEPTEGLDAKTETVVMNRLMARLAERRQGALIVSHRRMPLASCATVFTLAHPAAAARNVDHAQRERRDCGGGVR